MELPTRLEQVDVIYTEKVGAITTIDALSALDEHDPTDVILMISKPPAKEVRDKVMRTLQSLSKPGRWQSF